MAGSARGIFSLHRRARNSDRAESGFTLIELLIVMVILPFVVGALSLAIISVLSLQGPTTNRLSDAADAQIVSTNFENDVHTGVMLTTSSAVAGECGPGAQVNVLKPILSLEWGLNQASGYQSIVTYVLDTGSSGTQLVRDFCSSGPNSVPTSQTTVANNVSASTAPVVNQSQSATCVAGAYTPATEWVPTTCVATVSLAITEPEKGAGASYSYSLVSSPEASTSSSSSTQLNAPGSGCGFAAPGTGTYAASLCFVDFGTLVPSQLTSTTGITCPNGGEAMQSPISDTEYTLSFCLHLISPTATYSGNGDAGSCPVTGQVAAICAATVPTYASPPTSEAFLGDNSFYMNIPGDPALYETQDSGGGSNTPIYLQLYNIKVADVGGNLASGWELVTGDAESTDSGESIVWSTCSSVTANCAATTSSSPDPSASPALQLLPNTYNGNTASAAIGNACEYSPAPSGTEFPGTYLTGIGTATVECADTDSSDKSGTVMLDALTPETLSVKMIGTGLEAIFVGVLLP